MYAVAHVFFENEFINLMNLLKGPKFIKILKLSLQPAVPFSGLKEKMKDLRKSRAQPKTEIVSLTPDCMEIFIQKCINFPELNNTKSLSNCCRKMI